MFAGVITVLILFTVNRVRNVRDGFCLKSEFKILSFVSVANVSVLFPLRFIFGNASEIGVAAYWPIVQLYLFMLLYPIYLSYRHERLVKERLEHRKRGR